MALYTLNMENFATLNTDEKVVQMTDMIQIHGETLTKLLKRIDELEEEVARMGEVIDADDADDDDDAAAATRDADAAFTAAKDDLSAARRAFRSNRR